MLFMNLGNPQHVAGLLHFVLRVKSLTINPERFRGYRVTDFPDQSPIFVLCG